MKRPIIFASHLGQVRVWCREHNMPVRSVTFVLCMQDEPRVKGLTPDYARLVVLDYPRGEPSQVGGLMAYMKARGF